MSPLVAEAIAVVCLVAVLGFAGVRPRGLPEGVGAVPAALLVVVVGALPWATAWQEVQGLGPTVAFLAAILMLAHLCREEGMSDAAGQLSRAAAADLLAQAVEALGRPCEAQLRLGFTEREVTAAAAGVDLLVIARDGDRTRLGPRSIGRHTRFVLDHAPCTVALVWPGETPGLDSIPAPPPDR